MGISIPRAGLLISAFAVGMVVGAPLLAAATLRLPRRTTLIALLVFFGLGQVAGALAPTYDVLFASRVVSALACAGFWAVGAAVAMSLVPVNARARAMAVMVGGLSIANIVGVPAGCAPGAARGLAVGVLGRGGLAAVGLVGVVALVPRTAPATGEDRPRLARELRIYADRQVWLTVLTIALNAAAVFAVFSYLAPLLTDVAGLEESRVPTVLALFGLGGLVGTVIGGRIADARLFGMIYGGVAASSVVLALLALLSGDAVAATSLALLLGVTAFLTAPALNARMFDVAGAAPDAGGCDDHLVLQHRQHRGPLARRPGHQRGLGLPGGRVDGSGPGGGGTRGDGGGIGSGEKGPGQGEGAGPRRFGRRSPASVSRRSSSLLPTSTAPARTASA